MALYDKGRIDALRAKALHAPHSYEEYYLLFNRELLRTFGEESFARRYALAFRAALDQAAVSIDDGELLVGKAAVRELTPEEKAEWETIQRYSIPARSNAVGQDSHMTVDYDRLLNNGIRGIRQEIADRRAALDITRTEDLEKDDFYESCDICLDAVVRFSKRYAEAARKLAGQAEPQRRQELLNIADMCERVPEEPATSFREALQSVNFLTFCLSIKPLKPTFTQYQLGRPDRYLLSFYEHDMRTGALTAEEARTLADCLCILMNQRVPSGLSNGYMVGGRDKDGRVVSNDLTRLFMTTIGDLRLVYPAVGLCCTKETPKEDLELACDLLGQGCSHPALFNDDVITAGLRRYGLPPEEACSYIQSTCVEITPIASSNVWVASPYTNLEQVLLDVLDKEYGDMDALLDAYFAHLGSIIRENFIYQNRCRLERGTYHLDPLLSCFVKDCLETGVDIEHGGARYNWIMPSFVGLSNVVDSLAVIEKWIFGERKFTFAGLNAILRDNFAGHEEEKRLFTDCTDKYGNDCDQVDGYAQRISQWIAEECTKYTPAYSNARLIPSLFCWIMHDALGQQTGASPDGRTAGFPLGDGSGPAQGRERKGPTASILSSTKWDHTPFIGGIAVNMKFSKSLFTDASKNNLMALVRTYLERGGFELQINVTDKQQLLDAREHPEEHQDLVVRIGGYSDYFVRLTPTMQAEVIERTEHVL